MPYQSLDDLPASVKKLSPAEQRQWRNIWNSAYAACKKKGDDDTACEASAFKQANGVVRHDAGLTLIQRGLSLFGLSLPAPVTAFKTWDTAYVNDLPDSSFLFIEPGGEKDGDGKTTPRSKRHLPVKDAGGKVDLSHVRAAISRLGQPDTLKGVASMSEKAALQRKAQSMLQSAHAGEDPQYAGSLASFALSPVPTPLYVSDDGTVYRSGLLFRAGDYPDKKFAMTPDELKAAAEAFAGPIDMDLEHVPTLLDGNLGQVVDIFASDDGEELHGIVAIPKWLDEMLPERKVSATWDRETKQLAGLALVRHPRVADAALMAAFSIEQAIHYEDARKDVLAFLAAADPDGDAKQDENTKHGQALLQSMHDIVARRGAICSKDTNGTAKMTAKHEHEALQAIHDATIQHGAACNVTTEQANSLRWPPTYPGIHDANSPYFTGDETTTAPAEKEGRQMSKLEEFFKGLLSGEDPPVVAGGEGTGQKAEPAATQTATMSAEQARLVASEEEVRRLRAENSRIQSERMHELAVAFADQTIREGKALPVERPEIVTAYIESATSDAVYGPAKFTMDGQEVTRSRVETLKALYAVRPAHMLTNEMVTSAVHKVLLSQPETVNPHDPKPADEATLKKLMALTPIGRSLADKTN